MNVTRLVAATANVSRFLDTYAFLRRKITKSQVAIIVYHRVCPKEDNGTLQSLAPQIFEQQIRYLTKYYEVLSLDELVRFISQRKVLPEKAVVINIDDGYRDNYIYAYPVLKKYSVPATIFLTSGQIGTKDLFWWDKVGYSIFHTTRTQFDLDEIGNYSIRSEQDRVKTRTLIIERLKKVSEERKVILIEKIINLCNVEISPRLGERFILTWDEVKEMSNNGIDIGSHSVNHLPLTRVPWEQAKHEISQSKKDIEEKLGRKITAFAYPFGLYNLELAKFVKQIGFSCAVSVSPYKLISRNDNIYTLSRIASTEDFNKFKVMIYGLWGDISNIFHIKSYNLNSL